ncbi:MAG: hypothetical protein EKK62_17545 [Acidimicrobiia bacterium]|nr:hypothetical protein [Microthrixaceae bacterium]MCB9401687.1 hypothetical protein [Microthrixaceae bacterium]MCO5304590.1 hypothetical protein [Microthrixaceae bacterium]RTL03765.1 MAG: hypothetical protein EKK62_17545 [Acidimicrobiia bacterium]
MDAHDVMGRCTEVIDKRAPGLVRFVAGLRWGGLRTVDPDGWTWGAEAAAGVGLGLGARGALRVASGDRVRVPLLPAVLVGWLGSHLAVWRWDTLRWRKRRVALVVDLPVEGVVAIAEQLGADGRPVQRWEKGSGRSRVHGLWCRAGDVRAVNRAIDAAGVRRP